MTDKVRVEIEGAVRTVTMCRPEKGNALDAEMLAAMEDAFAPSPGPGPDERVAVIRSEGRVFCSGLDLRGGLGKDQNVETLFDRVQHWPLPVVAVVQGAAIAGGNELALHSDFVVASEAARFGMSLAQIGLAPTWFLTKKLMEVGGPVVTREILLLGDPVPASRMADLGLIARCVPAERMEAEASAIIDRLVRNAPLSLRAMKATINRQLAFRDLVEHADADEAVRRAMKSADAKEGVRARLERRDPNFVGA
ncbi:MAG: enoyl-CoA hydratase-related protein [Acidimicrobiia bacterium]|nr:enoyl-CoA hydratase-related protein [Acidimicrobiia bacterium]